MKLLSSTKIFGGQLSRYCHNSVSVKGEMIFSIFIPPKSSIKKVPVLYWV
jgi:S-formylglutathione hydrolase